MRDFRLRDVCFFGAVVLATAIISSGTLGAQSVDQAAYEINGLIRERGIPNGWLPSQDLDRSVYDPLAITAIWHDLDQSVSDRRSASQIAQQTLGLNQIPQASLIHASFKLPKAENNHERSRLLLAVKANDVQYEEAVLRSLFGPNHVHHDIRWVHAPAHKPIPRLRDAFKWQGQVSFQRIRNRFNSDWVNASESSFDQRNQKCHIVSQWNMFSSGTVPWIRENYRWRAIYEIHFVRDKRHLAHMDIDGKSRLALITSVAVGRRSGQGIQEIFRTDPLVEDAFSTFADQSVMVLTNGYAVSTRPRNTPGAGLSLDGQRDFRNHTALLSPSSKQAILRHDWIANALSNATADRTTMNFEKRYYTAGTSYTVVPDR